MNRQTLLILAASSLAGCYADYVAPAQPVDAYVEPSPVSVSMAPPPPRYETVLSCGYGQSWIGGYWDWNGGGWGWQPGYCQTVRAGYSWVPPVWRGGVYVRGYWGRPGRVYGGGYAAPAYRGGYVAPPAPAYRPAPAYVAPAPAYRGGYVAPPAPAYRPAPSYVAPPAPAYRPAPGYVAPPAPAYRPAPAAPAYRPAAPVYRPAAPARVVPPPAPAQR